MPWIFSVTKISLRVKSQYTFGMYNFDDELKFRASWVVFAASVSVAPVAVGHRVVPRAASFKMGGTCIGVVGGAVGLRELSCVFWL